MEILTENILFIFSIMCIIATIVSAIIEVIKGIPIFSKIPHDVQVIVLSLILCLTSYFAYISYTDSQIIWYYFVGTILAGFIVSYVVMYGFEKLVALYKRFRNITPK